MGRVGSSPSSSPSEHAGQPHPSAGKRDGARGRDYGRNFGPGVVGKCVRRNMCPGDTSA